jgi:catalase-peroxidase
VKLEIEEQKSHYFVTRNLCLVVKRLTHRVGVLTNDFFVNLTDMGTVWTKKPSQNNNAYEGRDRNSGRMKWTASQVDLVFGSHSVLRALAEMYACKDSQTKFLHDFCKTFVKVMDLDRFDVDQPRSQL